MGVWLFFCVSHFKFLAEIAESAEIFIGLRLPLSRLGIAQASLALRSLLHRFADAHKLCHTDGTDGFA